MRHFRARAEGLVRSRAGFCYPARAAELSSTNIRSSGLDPIGSACRSSPRLSYRSTSQTAVGKAALPALVLALVWCGGFELTPIVHLFAHTAGAAHCHGAACHEHESDGEASELAAASHGAGSLEHRDVAAVGTPPAIVAWPMLVVGLAGAPPSTHPGSGADLAPTDTRARGPPAGHQPHLRFSALDTVSAVSVAGRERVQFRTLSHGRELA